MNTTHKFNLIDGTFNAPEAAQMLLSLVRSKIDFHNLEQFSNEERFGRDSAHSERRLAELRKLHDTLKTLCASAVESGERLHIEGRIVITLSKD